MSGATDTQTERAPICPNCARTYPDLMEGAHVSSGCILAAFAALVRDRGEIEVTSDLLREVDDDPLWDNYLGPAVDHVEAQLREIASRK